MPHSQYPQISGKFGGKVLRCAPDCFPIYEKLYQSSLKGSQWARMLVKGLADVSSGALSRVRGEPIASREGGRRYQLAFPGVRFIIERTRDDVHILSKVAFPTGSSLDTLHRALTANWSVNVEPTSASSLSKRGENFLKSIEVLRLTPYDDQTGQEITSWVEGATIGYGHLIHKPEWSVFKNGITQEQANQIFQGDVEPFVTAVKQHINTPQNQHQFDALVILAFNIGVSAFSSSSVVSLINNPDAKTPFNNLEMAWKAWRRSQGTVNQGLVNRRAAEWNIYTQGIYQRW